MTASIDCRPSFYVITFYQIALNIVLAFSLSTLSFHFIREQVYVNGAYWAPGHRVYALSLPGIYGICYRAWDRTPLTFPQNWPTPQKDVYCHPKESRMQKEYLVFNFTVQVKSLVGKPTVCTNFSNAARLATDCNCLAVPSFFLIFYANRYCRWISTTVHDDAELLMRRLGLKITSSCIAFLA